MALLNLIFLSAAAGLYISVKSWNEKRALAGASTMLVGLAVLLPTAVVALAIGLNFASPFRFVALSPAYALWQATVPRSGNLSELCVSLLWTQTLGWLCVRATCRALPRCWQKQVTAPASAQPLSFQFESCHKQRDARLQDATRAADGKPVAPVAVAIEAPALVRSRITAQQRACLLDQNPMMWLVLRRRAAASGAWVAALTAGGCALAFLARCATDGPTIPFPSLLAFLAIFFLNISLKIYMAAQASQAFALDRSEDTLELLLATPLTAQRLVNGHVMALRELTRRWISRVLWMDVSWLALTLLLHGLRNWQDAWLYALSSIVVIAFLVPDVQALTWTALWKGVISGSAHDARRESARVSIWPWFLTCVFTACTFFAQNEARLVAMIFWWAVFSAGANRWFTQEACSHLKTDLNLWALRRALGELEHYDGWRRLGWWLGLSWKRFRMG